MTKKNKTVRVIPSKGRRHKTELRVFAREIMESYCRHPGCKFKGKRAQQGVCFSTERFDGGTDWRHIDAAFKFGKETTDETRRILRGKSAKYKIEYLLATVESDWVNKVFQMDELVRLRRKVALMELRLGKRSK